MSRLATTFTDLEFVNPFVLASAPPTESKRKILKAFEAGWGGVVTKTIGLHPVENVAGPKTIYQRSSSVKPYVSRLKRENSVAHSSWNWELISDCLGPLKLCHYLLTKGVTENGTETVFG